MIDDKRPRAGAGSPRPPTRNDPDLRAFGREADELRRLLDELKREITDVLEHRKKLETASENIERTCQGYAKSFALQTTDRRMLAQLQQFYRSLADEARGRTASVDHNLRELGRRLDHLREQLPR